MILRPQSICVSDDCLSYVQRAALVVCALVFVVGPLPAQDSAAPAPDVIGELKVQNLWWTDPNLPIPDKILKFNPIYRTLWLEAIQHPEADLQQEIATMIEQVHRAGNSDFSDKAEVFRKLLNEDNHPTVNLALASLICAIDDRDSADRLFELLSPRQIEMSQVVEPALARWNYEPIRKIWHARLDDPGARRSHLVLAIDGLMQVRDESAANRLLQLATDGREKAVIRLAAARAVGQIRSEGLTTVAQRFAADVSPRGIISRLCAVEFLSRHESDASNELLQKLSLDVEPTVAARAWRRLLQIDSALAVTQADDCLTNEDPIVRGLVVQSMFEQPTLERIDRLGVLMDDRHPDVRNAARISLHRLALVSDEFDRRVRVAGMIAVQESRSGYRGVEQSLLLLAALDHKNVAGIAAELLDHDHPWVLVTAAWALRRLQVKETLPAMLDRATRVSDAFLGRDPGQRAAMGGSVGMDQAAHLFDAFGIMKYREAEDLLRRYIPKNLEIGFNSRPAAIAALGYLYQDNPDPELVALLIARLNDRMVDPPDIDEVFYASTIAMGRMKAKSALPEFDKYYDGKAPHDLLSHGYAWSIREITGRGFPAPVASFSYKSGFNLEPGRARMEAARTKE